MNLDDEITTEHPAFKALTDGLSQVVPALYTTEEVATDEKVITAHISGPDGATQFWICEYSPYDGLAFGYAMLEHDTQNAEWGYTSLLEVAEVNLRFCRADGSPYFQRTTNWRPVRFGDLTIE